MANPEHEAIFKQGVAAWNQWRIDHPEIEPDLSSIYDGKGFYPEVNLSHTNLSHACFAGTFFHAADFRFANLEHASLGSTSPRLANFSHADLSYAKLINVRLSQSNWVGATLRGTQFNEVTAWHGADLRDCRCSGTVFISVNFSGVLGLDQVQHKRKSIISVDSIVMSKGHIPDVFLRKCGVPDKLIAMLPALWDEPPTP